MRRIHTLIGTAFFILCAGPALAACDITDLPCWGDNSKCHIKFRNKTGEGSGSGGGTKWTQVSLAATIRVTANDSRDKGIGNKLNIPAGSSGTINLDKKGGFAHIDTRKMDGTSFTGFRMSCATIRAVLQGSAKCKVFSTTSNAAYPVAYNCNGGDVTGAGDGMTGTKWYLHGVEQ